MSQSVAFNHFCSTDSSLRGSETWKLRNQDTWSVIAFASNFPGLHGLLKGPSGRGRFSELSPKGSLLLEIFKSSQRRTSLAAVERKKDRHHHHHQQTFPTQTNEVYESHKFEPLNTHLLQHFPKPLNKETQLCHRIPCGSELYILRP